MESDPGFGAGVAPETDAEFVERMYRSTDFPTKNPNVDRLLSLARRGAAVQWRPISEAPKDTPALLYGRIDPNTEFEALRWENPSVFSGYWDSLDEAWCPHGGTWAGPFMEVTHWMPLPPPPKKEG